MRERVSSKTTVLSLTRRCELLRRRAEVLSRERRQLQLQAGVLASWSEGMALMLFVMSVHDAKNEEASGEHAAHFRQLVAQEVGLLQQLLPSGDEQGGSEGDAGAAAAPLHDPMGLFKQLMSQPPAPHSATMEPMKLVTALRESVQGTSLMLHLLNAARDADSRAKLQQDILRSISIYMQSAMPFIVRGNMDAVERLALYNLETLQLDVEGANQRAADMATVVPTLCLTEQQEEVIAAGVRLYTRLLASIRQERQELQLLVALGDEPPADSSSSGSTSGSDNEPLGSMDARLCRLEAQQRRTARLRLLLQKELCLKLVGMSWFLGTLTLEQLASAWVLSWPYGPRPALLAAEVLRAYEARVQANSK